MIDSDTEDDSKKKSDTPEKKIQEEVSKADVEAEADSELEKIEVSQPEVVKEKANDMVNLSLSEDVWICMYEF